MAARPGMARGRWTPHSPSYEGGFIITSHRICTACCTFKSPDAFYKKRDNEYYFCECKECRQKMQRHSNDSEATRLIKQRARFKRRYGITLEERNVLLELGCGICGTKEGRLFVDHNHSTGKVRGALCPPCNSGIGYLRDDMFRLLLASDYLRNHLSGPTASVTCYIQQPVVLGGSL